MKPPRSDWKEIVQAFKASGQTQKEWCQDNDESLGNLRYWLRKERKTVEPFSKDLRWQTLETQSDPPQRGTETTSIEVKIGDFTVTVTPEFDSAHLLRVLRTLSIIS